MEPAAAAPAACVPCNFQLANWTMAPAAWSPGFAAEPAESGGIYGGSWIQICAPNNGSGSVGQLVEYHAAATPQHYPIEKEAKAELSEVVLHNMDTEIYNPIRELFQEEAETFENEIIHKVKLKIHRYPKSIRDQGDEYTVPRVVAIGPYHHRRQHLQKAEQVKRVAAYHCILTESGSWSSPRLQEMYDKVVFAADYAYELGLYDQDGMAGIDLEDFRHMMFFDACFLVQYMAWYGADPPSDKKTDPSLRNFFYSHHIDIQHDVWLLENQLPWRVVEAVMNMMLGFQKGDELLEKFLASWRGKLQDRKTLEDKTFFLCHADAYYGPPHLLGLLRYYTIGRRSRKEQPNGRGESGLGSLSFSNSAIDLAQIGISVTPNKTGELVDMSLKRKDIRFAAELSLAPLSLDRARANMLVNMAAFELRRTPSFNYAYKVEDSAVCSYLLLLSMLVHKEDDVHELRRQDVLRGGGGLTNKQALNFFSSFQSLPKGIGFIYTIVEVERYKKDRKPQTKVRSFLYHGKHKTMCMLISKIGAVVTVIGTLVGIFQKVKSLHHAS